MRKYFEFPRGSYVTISWAKAAVLIGGFSGLKDAKRLRIKFVYRPCDLLQVLLSFFCILLHVRSRLLVIMSKMFRQVQLYQISFCSQNIRENTFKKLKPPPALPPQRQIVT